jgi:hypothetical protein
MGDRFIGMDLLDDGRYYVEHGCRIGFRNEIFEGWRTLDKLKQTRCSALRIGVSNDSADQRNAIKGLPGGTALKHDSLQVGCIDAANADCRRLIACFFDCL